MEIGNDANSNKTFESYLDEIADILETVRKPFLIMDSDLKVISANQRFYDTFNITPDQILQHHLYSALDNEWDIPALRHLIDNCFSKKDKGVDDYEIDHTFPRLGHKMLRVNSRCTTLSTLDKQVILLSIEDYTRRKLQEQKLRESEERFRRMFETSNDGLLLVNKETGTIIDVNRALTELLGINKDELLQKKIQNVGIVEKNCDLQKLLKNLSVKGFYTFDNVLINLKTSKPFPAEITFTDKSSAIQANVRDISARIHDKELLQKSLKEWQITFNAVPDLIMIMDKDMRITRANDACTHFFSAEPGGLIGRHCYEIFNELDAPCPDCPVHDTLQGLKVHSNIIIHKFLGKTFLVSIAPILGENGVLVSLIHVARDITDLKKLEHQLQQTQKMEAIGTLAGGIAHDFNNILTPILGYAEMAIGSESPDSPIIADLQQVLIAAERAKELVKQILTFSRRPEGEPKPLKIQFALKETLKLLRSSIPSNIEIRENIDQNCDAIMADPIHIHQILMNLCTNAYQTMLKTGGILGFSLAGVELGPQDLVNKFELMPGPYVMLEVSDSGPGIPREVIDKIFEPYFTTKDKSGGTGLGLAVVHSIVNNYKGAITVYSELGKGSVFRVYFPVIEVEPFPIKPETPSKPLIGGSELILILDDEEIIVRMEEEMLRSLGYKVFTFTDCEVALKVFRSRPDDFDLIITDMTMPKMTGDHFAKEVLNIRPNMSIILCTGFNELISEKKAYELGIRKYLTKPILKRELANAVRQVLDAK
ncbi:MAG: PAS domain-containing protein [Proteobacteria bacterium]|nr:PAS domain-containing protein [Pseudomonadota bacterium]